MTGTSPFASRAAGQAVELATTIVTELAAAAHGHQPNPTW